MHSLRHMRRRPDDGPNPAMHGAAGQRDWGGTLMDGALRRVRRQRRSGSGRRAGRLPRRLPILAAAVTAGLLGCSAGNPGPGPGTGADAGGSGRAVAAGYGRAPSTARLAAASALPSGNMTLAGGSSAPAISSGLPAIPSTSTSTGMATWTSFLSGTVPPGRPAALTGRYSLTTRPGVPHGKITLPIPKELRC